MARSSAAPSLMSLGLLLVLLSAAAAAAASGDELSLGWIPVRSGCSGSVVECVAGEEFELGSEVTRRILARSYYISYAALRRDSVPCSRRGASYYNCRPGARANPYSRSCSAITRCRR
ncbi:protein RALF-like 33 [Musa acuminata AAA Group]|uniref:protein RALF-like 33 n=1 Tax=Musa acuminata AAA Group TaxID=214697 RepID=UPI0031CE0D25